jgi:flagellum-specific peptidoglycan hydrolase FlgJ
MTDLSVFSEEELEQLWSVISRVGFAALSADQEGVIGFFKKLFAIGTTIKKSEKHENEFVRALAVKFGQRAEEQASRANEQASEEESDDDDPDKPITEALDSVPAAIALLRAKVTENEVHAFQSWLIEIATKVTEAAKGISEAEQRFIDRLTETVKG